MDETNLRDLPNSILNLPNDCLVNIENSGLSMQILNRLQELIEVDGYQGPTITYSIEEEEEENQTLDNIFGRLSHRALIENRSLETDYPNISQYIQSNSGANGVFQTWLSRLFLMQPIVRSNESGFSRRIMEYLDLAEANESFRQVFFGVINGAAATCGDRMALSV